MHKEILSKEQVALLPFVGSFKKEFYLVGGTAIALHIGHRQSIDFDLFKIGSLHPKKILTKISSLGCKFIVTRNVSEQLNVSINNVKFTFFDYPFNIPQNCNFDTIIKLPDLLSLAAMKAYALGRRSKWKDYIDLYFILKYHFTLKEIVERANDIYKELFSEKLFRAQICFFDDIDYTEEVSFIDGFSVEEKTVKTFLIDTAIELI